MWTTRSYVVCWEYLVYDFFSLSFAVMQESCGITKLAAQKDMDLFLSVISWYCLLSRSPEQILTPLPKRKKPNPPKKQKRILLKHIVQNKGPLNSLPALVDYRTWRNILFHQKLLDIFFQIKIEPNLVSTYRKEKKSPITLPRVVGTNITRFLWVESM